MSGVGLLGSATVTTPYLTERLQGFGTTIRPNVGPRGAEAVNLGQGFDTDGPAEVAEAARQAIRDGHNWYPPLPGFPAGRPSVSIALALGGRSSTPMGRC